MRIYEENWLLSENQHRVISLAVFTALCPYDTKMSFPIARDTS